MASDNVGQGFKNLWRKKGVRSLTALIIVLLLFGLYKTATNPRAPKEALVAEKPATPSTDEVSALEKLIKAAEKARDEAKADAKAAAEDRATAAADAEEAKKARSEAEAAKKAVEKSKATSKKPKISPRLATASIPYLLMQLKDEKERVAEEAEFALIQRGESAAAGLVETLEEESLRLRAARCLVGIGGPATKYVVEMFASHDQEARRYAMYTAVYIGEPAKAELGRALTDPRPSVAVTARDALRLIINSKSSVFTPPAKAPVTPPVPPVKVEVIVKHQHYWVPAKASTPRKSSK